MNEPEIATGIQIPMHTHALIHDGAPRLRDLFTFLGLSSKQSAKQLSGSADEVVRGISAIIDDLLLAAIEKRTASEFNEARADLFPKYVSALRAMSEIIHIVVPRLVIERVVYESLSEMESDFRDQALSRFGATMRDQALFTVWTLRKMDSLLSQIVAAGNPSTDAEKADRDFAAEFSYHLFRTRFHLDCLTTAIRFDKTIYPDVADELLDGLRSIVNAYGWARQGLDLRQPPQEPLIADVEWDDEDQELMNSSLTDLAAETKSSDGHQAG